MQWKCEGEMNGPRTDVYGHTTQQTTNKLYIVGVADTCALTILLDVNPTDDRLLRCIEKVNVPHIGQTVRELGERANEISV